MNLPFVQQRIAVAVTQELKNILRTEVSIGNVDIGLLNRIIVDDVLLNDREGKEMLKVTRLSAKFNPFSLLRGKIIISSVQLFGFNVNLNKQTPESTPNFKFVIDAFASTDSIKKETNIDLRINSILIRRGKIAYDVLSKPETPGKFNSDHILVRNIIANISLKALSNDSLNAYIKRLSFEEKGGFELKKLSMRALADTKRLKIDNFSIKLPQTSLIVKNLVMEYDSLENIRDVRFSGQIHASQITLKDVSGFVPALSHFNDPIQMDMRFNGTKNILNCPYLELKSAERFELLGDVAFQDLSRGKDAYVYGNLSNLHLSREGIDFFYRNLVKKDSPPPEILKRLGSLSFNGSISGYFNDLVTYGTFTTEIGTVKTDVKLSVSKETGSLNYSGAIKTDKFKLGKLVNKEDKLGDISFNLNIKGSNHQNLWPDINLKGLVSSIEFNKYTYEDIELDGMFKEGGFDGKIAMSDANGSFLLNGNLNLAQQVPVFNFYAQIDRIRPYDLHLTNKYKDSEFSLKIGANFTGNSIDNIIGEINVDSFFYQSPEKYYFLDNLNIKATQTDNQKLLKLTSSFMTATVEGNYSYNTIPTGILRTFERYIPSLLSVNNKQADTNNNFTFNIDVYNTEILTQILDIPLEMNSHSTIKGYFNDNAKKLRIEGYFPKLKYGDRNFESGIILCENPSDLFRCRVRALTYTNKESMVNLSLETTAKEDKLNTSIYWGNSSAVTYSGNLSALTSFFKTEGDKPILQANIDVLPSKVILNDTVWNIHPSRIAIDSGRVFVDNFLFEHQKQFLKVNGKLTKSVKDTVKVELNDINLGYVFDIISFHDVDFQGFASGSVVASQIFKEPILDANLHVKSFTFNNTLMGDMNVYGTWDKEQEGIFLDAKIREKDISSTNVKGFIFIKKKGLDLRIDADSTNIGFLGFFMRSISSDVRGRTTGCVRLFGGFKTLNLEGRAIADASFKIDVLNTSFLLKRDSVRLVPDNIQFRDIAFYDPEGHRGTISGDLFHHNLKDLSYRFHMNTNNMLVFNTKESPDVPFYGTIYGTGNVLINGGATSGLNVDVSMTTNKNTNFVYLTGMTSSATNSQFVKFVDKTPKRIIQDSLYLANELNMVKKDENSTPIDIRLNIQVDATPDATMKIIMDPISGDYISGKGDGNIRIDFFNKGEVKMFGNYTINQGIYKFSLQEIIRKDFTIQPGSTISFSGKPLDANLGILAGYTVNSASLNDLGLGENFTQNNVKVNCMMNLTGNLLKPTIKFDIDLPNVNEEERELVKSVVNTDEQMNMQILYLLGIGKFYTYDYNDRQSSSAMNSVLSSTLSGQLNNLLSQIINNNNWNFGTNLSTGDKGWTDVEVEGILSGQLLNNRLLINGNFGYRDNPLANTNFVGDFDIEWLLTKSGEIRLKAYNQANDRYFTKTTLTTQGIGIIYKKDFNAWKDLLIWHLKKRTKKASQERQETPVLPEAPRARQRR